jgi:hypothetical protein
MPTFDGVAQKDNSLIRKGLAVAIFVAPSDTPMPPRITDDNGDLLALDPVWRDLGWINEDGASWARETEVSDIYGVGAPEPLRSDVRRATKRLTVVALETNIVVLEQYLGMDLSAVGTYDGGESVIDEAVLPPFRYVKLLGIAKDTRGDGEYYLGRGFPSCRVTEVAEEVWQDGDTANQRSLTFTAFQDTALGTASRYYLGGPGRDPNAEGFPTES